MVRFVVLTTGERKLDNTFSQIQYELFKDEEHNVKKAFGDMLSLYASQEDDIVFMEDDIILGNKFSERVESVIAKHKADVINFFWNPSVFTLSMYTKFFSWNQCVYYPNKQLKMISARYNEIYESLGNLGHDIIIDKILSELNIDTWVERPCLVQHKDLDTLIHGRTRNDRRTIYFIDYIDELRIKYRDAIVPKNNFKLSICLSKHFERVSQEYNEVINDDQGNIEKVE